MKIKKGDWFKCLESISDLYEKDGIYLSQEDGCLNTIKGRSCRIVDDHLNCFSFVKKDENDPINPSHYKSYSVETIDMMIAIYGKEKVAIHCELTAFKYRMRMGKKKSEAVEQVDGHFINCYKKEQWYLNKAKELRNDNLMTNL